MIGIKGMELPKSCKECDLNCTLYRTFNEEEYEIKRHPNCKLVDLGKEDMDFEDLKEKCKNISTGDYNHYFSIRIDSGTIFSFYETC